MTVFRQVAAETRRLRADGYHSDEPRPAVLRAVEGEPAAERLHPVGQPAQAAAFLVCAAGPVVDDGHLQRPVVNGGSHEDAPCARVLVSGPLVERGPPTFWRERPRTI